MTRRGNTCTSADLRDWGLERGPDGVARPVGTVKAPRSSRRKRSRVDPICYPIAGGVKMQLPVLVVSESNRRDHWTKKYVRSSTQKASVGLWLAHFHVSKQTPKRIVLKRLGAKELDQDNLRGAFKATVDSIAEYFGVDDGPDGPIAWDYDQVRHEKDGIEITIL